MTDKEILAEAKKEAGSVRRLHIALELILGKGAGPSYSNLNRVFRGEGSVTSGIRTAIFLFLAQPEAFKERIRMADLRKNIPYSDKAP